MEDNEGVRKFISCIKELSDKLGDIGEIVESSDLVTVTLKGLVPDYKVFISTLAAREKPPNIEELTGILIQEEEIMKNYDLYAGGSYLALMEIGRYTHKVKPWSRPWNGDRGKQWNGDRGRFHQKHKGMAQTNSDRNNVDGHHWGKPRHPNRNHYENKFYRNRNYNGIHNGIFFKYRHL